MRKYRNYRSINILMLNLGSVKSDSTNPKLDKIKISNAHNEITESASLPQLRFILSLPFVWFLWKIEKCATCEILSNAKCRPISRAALSVSIALHMLH